MSKLLHVNCKHCGQSVEVADLLTSAEQPCPHCRQPLLDDLPVHDSPPQGIWAQRLNRWGRPLTRLINRWIGTGIMISREEAMLPPPRVCINCGASATHVVKESILIQGITIGFPRHFDLLAPYCDKHYRLWRRGSAALWLVCLIFLVTIVIFWLRPQVGEEFGLSKDTLVKIWCYAFLGCAAALLIQNRLGSVYFLARNAEYIDAQGASPEFVRAMQALRTRRQEGIP